MKNYFFFKISILVCLIISFNVFAQVDKRLEPYLQTIEVNQQLGHLLSQQDWAAEVATDAIIRLGADLSISNKKLKAFIVERQEYTWVFSYIGKKGFSLGIYYQIEVDINGPIEETYHFYKKPKKLTQHQKLIFKATQLAKKQEFKKCTSSYNNVAIHLIGEKGKDNFYIYLLAATNNPNLNIGGGHHRFLIEPQKKEVKEHYSHSNDCLLSTTNKGATSLVFTHMTSDVPNEFHIYMSYLYKMPLYVLTVNNGIIWKVNKGKIEVIEFSNEKNKSIPLVQRMRDYVKNHKESKN